MIISFQGQVQTCKTCQTKSQLLNLCTEIIALIGTIFLICYLLCVKMWINISCTYLTPLLAGDFWHKWILSSFRCCPKRRAFAAEAIFGMWRHQAHQTGIPEVSSIVSQVWSDDTLAHLSNSFCPHWIHFGVGTGQLSQTLWRPLRRRIILGEQNKRNFHLLKMLFCFKSWQSHS